MREKKYDNFEFRKKTALVIIDLQKGIAGREGFAPYSAQEVLAKNKELVTSLKKIQAL